MAGIGHLKKCIGQRVIFGFEGTRIPSEILRLDEEWGIGGYMLGQKNFEDFEHLLNLNEELWGRGQGTPPFIGIHQEGGQIHEVPDPFTRFPDMAQMGQVSSVSVAYEVGAVIGRELTSTGFNLNFAPVLDLNLHSDNPMTARRAISPDPDRICTLARAIIRGLHDNSIVACGKHFPGHGETPEDSHLKLPVCSVSADTFQTRELTPYRNLIQNPPHLDMVMPAHIIYEKLDKKQPATLSRQILQEILRLQIGFKGLIVTDDMIAPSMTGHMELAEATVLGMDAGVDIFLLSGEIDKQVEVLETLLKRVESNHYPQHMIERGYRRVRDIKARHFRVLRTIDRQHARELVGNREHQRIARRLRDGK